MPDCPEMIGGMRDKADGHSCFRFVPLALLGKAPERVLISPPHALAQGMPFRFVDRFDKPTVFPIHALGSAVYKLAEAIEIKLCVLGLSGDRGPLKLA